MPEPSDISASRALLDDLISKAISADVVNDVDGGFVAVMGKKQPEIRQDVPAAFEMYSLLSHFLDRLPLEHANLGDVPLAIRPGVQYDAAAGRVVALIPVEADQLELIAHWVAQGLRSEKVRAMAGVLTLAFSIETHDEAQHLLPEWFAGFYVSGNAENCVPMLALRSITTDPRMGDWVAVALERMSSFGLPTAAAAEAVRQKTTA